uniref:Uncharacterized protein n=1 Tax=Arundo donax TaxID=35708 RepID=A0A0A8YLI2_ARUDO
MSTLWTVDLRHLLRLTRREEDLFGCC